MRSPSAGNCAGFAWCEHSTLAGEARRALMRGRQCEVTLMADPKPARAHVVTGGFPAGAMGGHDQDYARLRLLTLLAERDVPASVGNDFAEVAKWLPVSRLLITYVAGPYPDAAQCGVIEDWLKSGGHWLALHGT